MNVRDSRPLMIPSMWAAVNQCKGTDQYSESTKDKVTYRELKCKVKTELDIVHGASHGMSDWHSMGGSPGSPADIDMKNNLTYEIVKSMMPYLVHK